MQNVYTGPHCGSDSETIGIGFYEDEYCDRYIGDDFSVNKRQSSIRFDDTDLKSYYDKTCIGWLLIAFLL